MAATILLTGATDGIGLALARIWAGRAERLVLHGRRPIEEMGEALFTPEGYCRADLARAEAPAEVARFLEERGVDRLDLLVHNAGTGYFGDTAEQAGRSIRETVRVNLEAPIELTHRLLPLLRAAGGRVVFVSSIAATMPCAEYAVYAATKAALEGFARSLRIELAGEVDVQVVRPGATRTGMHAKTGVPPGRIDVERFPPAQKVAGEIVRAIDSNRSRTTIGLGNKLLVAAGRNLAVPLDGALRRKERRA